MKRWQELEKAVEDLLNYCNLRYVRIKNYRCFKCGQVQNSEAADFPDFHVPALHLYVECKTGKGKLSNGQKDMREAILLSGGKHLLLEDNTGTLLQFLEECGYIKT
jgi:hypothetical protein